MTTSATSSHAPRALTPLGFALLGFALGLGDLALLAWLDVRMTLSGADVRVPVVLLFASTFALLGFAVGHLREARARALFDQEVIRTQLVALSAERARALESEALASVGRMAASVAHEVRNPLGVIRASATVLEEELRGDDPDVARSCAFIRDEVARLDAFVGKLLGYARANELTVASVDPRELLRRAADLSASAAAAPTITVSAGSAQLDAELLIPAVVNLVQNAQQAAVERVAIDARAVAGALVIDIRDDGPGVAAADQARLFEPFFTTKRTGTGLGLAMARKLVRAHGGTLEYMTGLGLGAGGAGACFRATIPEAQAS